MVVRSLWLIESEASQRYRQLDRNHYNVCFGTNVNDRCDFVDTLERESYLTRWKSNQTRY